MGKRRLGMCCSGNEIVVGRCLVECLDLNVGIVGVVERRRGTRGWMDSTDLDYLHGEIYVNNPGPQGSFQVYYYP